MKKIYSIVAGILLTASVFAQAPQKMSYQAVIRNSSNVLVTSTPVGMKISILQGSSTGTAVYVETQTSSTNANGLVSLKIGSGTPVTGTFAGINWATGPYFIKTETDPTGGTVYTISGTNELMSVPYALFSTPGAVGATGATGAQGIQGLQGLTGNTGSVGAQGAQGLTGANGSVGATGSQGMQGLTGTSGSVGATGAQGIQGLTGTTGSVGATGAQGLTGATGSVGATGAQGMQGLTGTTGSVGATGAQGIQGMQGLTGATGSVGATGNDGKNSVVKTTAEPTGTNCATGGTKLEYGLDANNNGALDVGEINATLTKYVCNGVNGTNGSSSSGVRIGYASSANWTCPVGVTTITIELWGGGGGGGGGCGTCNNTGCSLGIGGGFLGRTGGNGGAGGYIKSIISVAPGTIYVITVGNFGAGGGIGAGSNFYSCNTGVNGGNGGASSFNGILSTAGGTGGMGAAPIAGDCTQATNGISGTVTNYSNPSSYSYTLPSYMPASYITDYPGSQAGGGNGGLYGYSNSSSSTSSTDPLPGNDGQKGYCVISY